MWLALWAQSPSPAPTEWVNFGTAGVVVVSFLLGWIWPRPAVERLLREIEHLRGELLALVRELLTEVRELRSEVDRLRQESRREPPP